MSKVYMLFNQGRTLIYYRSFSTEDKAKNNVSESLGGYWKYEGDPTDDVFNVHYYEDGKASGYFIQEGRIE